jgi:hypothetical protein
MKTIIVVFLLFVGCSINIIAPVEHVFYSGDVSGDFSVLVKTTDYHDIGDGAEVGFIVGMKTILTIKDKRFKSVRKANPITAISYWKNNSLLSDTGKQAILFLDEGENNIAVKIITVNANFIINTSFFGVNTAIPEPITVGDFPRGVVCSDKAIKEELVLLEEYIALDSAEWVGTTVDRLATGLWFVDRYVTKKVSENGISERMFQFINSNIDELKYTKAIFWAHSAIMYSSVVNPDSVEPYYLRYIIESPPFNYSDDIRKSFDLLKNRDYKEFEKLIADILNNPSSYADKSLRDGSLVDICDSIEKSDSLLSR